MDFALWNLEKVSFILNTVFKILNLWNFNYMSVYLNYIINCKFDMVNFRMH
jgi:hypothetical protein